MMSAVILAGLKLMWLEFYALTWFFCVINHLKTDGALELRVLIQDEAIRHSSNIVRHDASQPFILHLFEVAHRQFFRIVDPMIEERGHHLFRFIMLRLERLASIERVV